MTSVLAQERARVIDAYERRPDDGRYDSRRADQVAISASRARGWGAFLLRQRRDLGRVVEVGCGSGGPTRWALEAGATACIGVDVQLNRLSAARTINSVPCYLIADGQRLPMRSGSADTVLCSTLFSSVLDNAVAARIASEMERVLAPDGVVLWFDFFRDNPQNRDVRGVDVTHVRRLFPEFVAELDRVVLAPPLARSLLGHPRAAAMLEMVPFLRTHLVGGLRRR